VDTAAAWEKKTFKIAKAMIHFLKLLCFGKKILRVEGERSLESIEIIDCVFKPNPLKLLRLCSAVFVSLTVTAQQADLFCGPRQQIETSLGLPDSLCNAIQPVDQIQVRFPLQ